jgi:sigma-B regulation protein RsbU (phosphoserine phosphatase)
MIKLPKFGALQSWEMRILRPSTKLGRITLWFGALSALFMALHWITGSASGSKVSGWMAFVIFAFALCAFSLAFTWARRTLHPSTKLGRATLWLGGFSVLFVALRETTCSASGAKPSSWATFVTVVFAFCALLLACRWTWRHLMWRLRHRLIVTYIFIGVIPIVLLLLIAGISSYLFAGQFAAYIAISSLQSGLQHLRAENNALAVQLSTLERAGKLNRQIAGELATVSGENLLHRTVTVWRGKQGLALSTDGALLEARPADVPDAIKGNFSGFVIDQESLRLRVVTRYDERTLHLTVISDVPITPELLQPATSRVGSVTLFPPDREGNAQIPPPAKGSPSARKRVNAGHVPPPSNKFDTAFSFYTLFDVVDWRTGRSQTNAIRIVTRPSMLYSTLFATLGDKTKIIRYALFSLVIFFGLIEFVALFIGTLLSRSMTRSVARLYSATQYVEHGDLRHRIRVRGRDQMAALEQSFNSMTGSLARLMAEQKEKQRFESELAIGREVQESLFPHNFTAIASLEVHGVCRPARSVSGDYYDFIPLGTDRLVLAMGDISGKGISAALLMATVHAFVRAYSLEPEVALMPVVTLGAGPFSTGDPRIYYRGDGATQSQLAPGMLMTTLNYQLFRSTPLEKYATMFLGCYDTTRRELKYCNAGHPPPIMLRRNGKVSRLETSGTVVGLFDGATYDESTIAIQSGDLFVAFSDGVTEPENESGEFGEERLIKLISEHRLEPLSRIAATIIGSVADWIGGAEQPDDITVVLARAVEPSSPHASGR